MFVRNKHMFVRNKQGYVHFYRGRNVILFCFKKTAHDKQHKKS